MEKSRHVPVNIIKKNKCEAGNIIYLLAARKTWEDQSRLYANYSYMVEKYLHSNPYKDMVMKVEACGNEDTLTTQGSRRVTENKYVSTANVKKEDIVDSQEDIFCNTLSNLLNHHREVKLSVLQVEVQRWFITARIVAKTLVIMVI